MTSSNVPDVPIGMQRLSCMPCRKRKSKCDRSQPCSSCVLRNTERFCYTSTAEDESTVTATSASASGGDGNGPGIASGSSSASTNGKKRDERTRSNVAGSPSEVSPSGRPAKLRKSTNDSREDLTANGSTAFRKRNVVGQIRKNSDDALVAAAQHSSETDIDRSAILSAINSIKATLSGLEAKLGQTKEAHVLDDHAPPTVEWKDIDPWLPSKADCRTILDCLTADCIWLFSFINVPMFYKTFDQFIDGHAVPRPFAALTLFLVGAGLSLAPASHPAYRLPYKTDHKLFMEHGSQVLWPHTSPFAYMPESTALVQAQMVLCYYMALNGWADPGDAQLGKLLRCSRAIHLFDEDKWNLTTMSDWDVELRRRLAIEIAQLDRFMSMHFLRSTTLPQSLNVATASYYASDCYDVNTGALLKTNLRPMDSAKYHLSKGAVSQGAYASSDFLFHFLRSPANVRYQSARDVDAALEQIETQAIASELQFANACNLSLLTTPESFRLACQSLVLCTSVRRQRCTVMRQFLLDREAPVDLRVAALEHAKYIIETAPVLIALSSSPWLGFSPSWCSGHLFCAASTFAIVYLGEEDQQNAAPELDWFASKIFEVLDTLSVLGMRDRVAKRAEELLIALCTSRDTLRAKLVASKRGSRHEAELAAQTMGNAASASDTCQRTWPGFLNVLPSMPAGKSNNNHIPPAIVNIADAPPPRHASSTLISHPSRVSPSSSLSSFALHDPPMQQPPPRAFSSPDSFSANGSGDTPDTQNGSAALTSALDDAQWTALINSLDGDFASLNSTAGGQAHGNGNGIDFTFSIPLVYGGGSASGAGAAGSAGPYYPPTGMPTTPAIPL